MARVTFDPATYNSATAEYTVGGTFYDDATGRTFRYVQCSNNAGDNAIADGDVCLHGSATTWVACNALNGTGAALTANPPMGVGVGAISKGNYGFILVNGIHTNVKSTSTTAGLPQKISATAATCTDQTAATITPIGTSLTATSGGRCTVAVSL